MLIKLYDGSNYFRLVIEKDPTSLAPRLLYQNMVAEPGALHIWVWDGAGSRDARQQIWPDYKTKRVAAASDIYASMDYFRELLKHSTAYNIRIPGYEADDVIAALVEYYTTQGAKQIQILSNDFDLAALAAGRPHVIGGWRPRDNVPADAVQAYKTFVGDPSDCIPGVKGFGEKAWDAADKKVLRAIALACVREQPIDELIKHMFLEPVRGEASIKAWVAENTDSISRMFQCIAPIPVKMSTLVDHMERPIHDPVKVEAELRKFML